jgi:hypothetical protein
MDGPCEGRAPLPKPRSRTTANQASAQSRWKKNAVEATPEHRRAALTWLQGLEAGGGTEMRSGIYEALQSLREGAQRQVVLVTDGLIGFESEVLGEILEKLPAASRLHAVGVGSAVNGSLTAPAASAGRGVEVAIGLGEDPERAARRLAPRTAAPLVTEVEIEGGALLQSAPARLPDRFAGAPALVSLALRPEGGSLTVRGRTAEGPFSRQLEVRSTPPGEGSPAAVALSGVRRSRIWRCARRRLAPCQTRRAHRGRRRGAPHEGCGRQRASRPGLARSRRRGESGGVRGRAAVLSDGGPGRWFVGDPALR